MGVSYPIDGRFSPYKEWCKYTHNNGIIPVDGQVTLYQLWCQKYPQHKSVASR